MKKLELTGQKFKKLTVIDFAYTNKQGRTYWNCLCDCGTKKTISGSNIIRNVAKSCGCLKTASQPQPFNKPIRVEQNITGQIYNNFTAIKKDLNKSQYWFFKCICGNIKSMYKYDIISGKTKSCGCLTIFGEKKLNKTKEEMIGKKYNKLTIMDFVPNRGKSFFKCLCDCGNTCIVSGASIKNGGTKSCGCYISRKLNPGEAGLNRLYRQYKWNARNNIRNFDLTLEEFKEITVKDCFYCGTKPSTVIVPTNSKNIKTREYTSYQYNGIDRIDSNKGYIKDNIVPCCGWCNRIKRERTVEEFKKHITMIYSHLNRGLND